MFWILLFLMTIPETVTSESMEPCFVQASKKSGKLYLRNQKGTYNRDTVPASASVVLEDDVAALVDRKAVVLVVNHAKCMLEGTRYWE